MQKGGNDGNSLESVPENSRETRTFVIRLWRYKNANKVVVTNWYGTLKTVGHHEQEIYFTGLSRLSEILQTHLADD